VDWVLEVHRLTNCCLCGAGWSQRACAADVAQTAIHRHGELGVPENLHDHAPTEIQVDEPAAYLYADGTWR
jgi:hypothetical protein